MSARRIDRAVALAHEIARCVDALALPQRAEIGHVARDRDDEGLDLSEWRRAGIRLLSSRVMARFPRSAAAECLGQADDHASIAGGDRQQRADRVRSCSSSTGPPARACVSASTPRRRRTSLVAVHAEDRLEAQQRQRSRSRGAAPSPRRPSVNAFTHAHVNIGDLAAPASCRPRRAPARPSYSARRRRRTRRRWRRPPRP